jgi:putative redox protein
VKVVARRREGLTHEVEIEGGQTVVVDEPPEVGGGGLGPRPTQLLAASLAGCTAITMELYAARKGWDLEGLEVEVRFEYDRATPTSFEVLPRLPEELSEEQRERLLAIAGKCPVHKVLAGESPVTVSDRGEPAR